MTNYKKLFEARALHNIQTFIDAILKDNRIDINKGTRIVTTGTQISGPLFDHTDPRNGLSLKKVALFYKKELKINITETNQITRSMLSKLKVVVLCCFCNNTKSVSLLYFRTPKKTAEGYRCYTCKISHPLLVKLINESDVDPENNDTKESNNSNNNNRENDIDNNNDDHLTQQEKLARKLFSLQIDVQKLNIDVELEENAIQDLITNNHQLEGEIQELTDINQELEDGIEAVSDHHAPFEQELMNNTAVFVPSDNHNELRRLTQEFSFVREPLPLSNLDGWLKLYQRCVRVDAAMKNQTRPTELSPTKTTKGPEGVDFIHLGDDSKDKGTAGFMIIIFGREMMITKSTSLLEECANDPLVFREKYFSIDF